MTQWKIIADDGWHKLTMKISSKKSVSIIIRSYNEEDWISHCLNSVFSQDYNNFEVIVVDNCSNDKTIDIVKTYPIKKIVYIENYIPGGSINLGIESSTGDIIVLLSAHCVPKYNNWLTTLVDNFNQDNIAGVYGRQLPVSFSSSHDIRDLFITFGLDKRIQVRDYFFHNANSALLRTVWNKFKFNEDTTNIEDRIWAKSVIEAGHQLVYEPEAEVYHHHGIHQNQNINRIKKTIKVLKKVENFRDDDWLPDSKKPKNMNIVAFVPIKEIDKRIHGVDLLFSLIEQLTECRYIKKIYILSKEKNIPKKYLQPNIELLDRPNNLFMDNISVGGVLKWGLEKINSNNIYPDYVIYAAHEYAFRPKKIFTKLIKDVCYKGFDSAFIGYTEYSSFWYYDTKTDDYVPSKEMMKVVTKKHPLLKSLLGAGCITRPQVIRNSEIISKNNIGVITTSNFKYSLRTSDQSMFELIKLLYGS